jgi:hypothetical protein
MGRSLEAIEAAASMKKNAIVIRAQSELIEAPIRLSKPRH